MTAIKETIKERPIMFTPAMVQAILEGRKTQTRRVFKEDVSHIEKPDFGYTAFTPTGHISVRGYYKPTGEVSEWEWFKKCPYGKRGDVLYVKETWAYYEDNFGCGIDCEYGCQHGAYIYRIDLEDFDCGEIKWKSPLFMPKKAARLWLQIEDVKVERVQDISEDDAIAEGVGEHEPECHLPTEQNGYPTCNCGAFSSYVELFAKLWNSINGEKEGCSWDDNPFVWVIQFKVLSTTGKPENLS